MPRIDPAELISCLAILLNRNGGINSTREVVRIARLMARYSKKLVSKCIYVSVLKSTEPELQDEFLSAGGFELVTDWLTEGVANDNWPLCKEVLILLHNLPISARKLINEGGDMAKKASKCSTLSNLECRSLCSELMKKWGLALTEYLNGDIESASRFLNYSLAELPLPIPVVPSVPESSPEHKSESDEELLPILDFYPKHGNKKGKKKKKKSENDKEKIMDKEEEVFKGTVPILKIVRESGKLATTLKSRARPSPTSVFPEENLESSSLEQLPVVEVDKGLPVVEVDLCKTDTVVHNKAKESRKGKLGQINVFEDEDEKFLRKPVKRKPKNEQEKGKKVQKRTKKEEEDSEEEESEEEEEVKPKKRRDKSKKTESKSKKMQKKAEKEEESLDEEEDDSENEDGVKPKKGRGKPKKVGKKPKKIQKKANKEEETSEENESEEDIEETTTKFSAKPKKPVENPKRMKKKITGEERILGEAEKPKKKRVKPKNVDGRSIKMRKKANKGEEKSSEEESDEEEETPKKTMGKPKNPQKRAKRKEETSEEESEEEKPKKGYKKSKKGEDNTKNMLKMTRHEEESSETEGEMSKKDEKGPLKFRKLEIRLFKDSENLTDDQEKSLKDLQQALKAMDKLKKDCEEVKKQPEKSKDEEEKLKKEQEYSKKAEPIPENELVDGSEIDPKDVQKEKEAKEAKKVEDQTEKVNVDKIHEKIECKTDKNSENKVDKKLEEKIDKKLENKTEKKSEEKLDIKSENKTDRKSEEKIDKKMEDKTGKKLEDKTDKKSEAKTDNRSEEKPDKKSEDKTEKKSDNKVDKKSDDIKCEKRVEELRSDKKEAHKKEEIKSKVKDKMIAEKESSKKEKGDSTSKRDDRPAKKEDYRSEKSFSKEKSKSLKEKQSEIDKRTLESLGMLARTNFSSLKIPKKSKPDEVKDEGIKKMDKVEEKKLELSKTKDITLERKSAPVKVFNSKFRSHGCEEIAPPAPKKAINKEPLTLKPVLKRPPANGDDIPPIKKLKSPLALLEVEEGKQARPGGIKLINPRPMFTDSSLFMDAISAGAKPEKKRKLKPNESEKEHKKEEVKEEKTSIKPEEPEVSPKEEEKMDTALSPVKPQFKFYKDILEEDEEDNDEKPLAQIKREQEEKMKELEKEKVTVEEPSEEVKKEPEIIEEKEQKEASAPPDLPNIEIGDLPPAPPINFGSVLNKDTGKKGVLVYHRTSKTKKSVRWKAEEDLHEFFVFDLDETERVNVNRLKFQDMKQADKLIEKELAKSCVEERLPWRLIVCDIPEGQLNFVPGMNSEEKIIQSEHEANTLASFYFNKNMIPFSPMEPSPEIRTERSVTSEIPLEEIDPSPDNLYDYSHTGWPAPKTDLVAPEMFLPHHELPGPMPPEHQMPINPAFFPQMGGMPPMAGPSHPRLQGPPGHFGGARPPFPVQNYSNGDTWMTGDGSMFVEPQMGPDMRMPHGMPIHPPDAAHAYRPLRPWRRDPGNWNREPPKRMPSPAPCVHFHARGACRFGNRCFFLH